MPIKYLASIWLGLALGGAGLVASPAPPRLVPENLAFQKPAIASGTQPGNEPANAVDGDPGTRWCAPDGGDGYWWQVDLQSPQTLAGCQISWEKENGVYRYRIQGSSDATHWRTLWAENNDAGRPLPDAHKFHAEHIRYVRITVTHPSGTWASFWEVEVWGTNLVAQADTGVDPRLTGVRVPKGFAATYFAGPPNISYPTCISASPTGEVFVGVDQNGSIDQQPNRGWVVRCVDTNGDGTADQFNIFARMDSPRGLVYDHHVLYVMHPPVLEAFYDDTGKGVANRSEILVRGLAHGLNFRGADHTCNGVRMGIDGWLYIALGDYGALEATGKDGRKIHLHGGGVVRVRPDGTGLEIVARGTRNIYDVAIDPFMDIFTCDNTNDGDDWNVRLSHMLATANYGYPSLFRNFSDEMIPTMADYGGGAPTGSLFLDEPGFPDGLGYGLYCCQWGWDSVTRHPLQAVGASFTPRKENFIHLPRPTGIDADGLGNLYVASWLGATFNYVGSNVGYVMCARPTNYQTQTFPNLDQADDGQLLKLLAAPSAVWRLHVQREILRRKPSEFYQKGLQKLARSRENRAVRAAAVFTLEQYPGAQEILLKLAQDETLRPLAIHAVCDRADAATVPTDFLVRMLNDQNPSVRLQAVIGLNRLHRVETAGAILPLTADSDPSVAHVAFRALLEFNASEVCLQAVRENRAELIPGAMRVLRNLPTTETVDGLIRAQTSPAHEMIFQALCRLYYREADYDGSWWGTRPDTSGPYYKPVTWEKSAEIGAALQQMLAQSDETALRSELGELKRHKLDLPGFAAILILKAQQRPALTETIIGVLGGHPPFAQETISFLHGIVLNPNQRPSARAAALHALENASGQREAATEVFADLAALHGQPFLKPLRAEYIIDSRNATVLEKGGDHFKGVIETGGPEVQQLGYAMALNVAQNPNSARAAVKAADEILKLVDNPTRSQYFLRAIEEVHATNYAGYTRRLMRDSNPEVAALASTVLRELEPQAVLESGHVMARMSYEEILRTVPTLPGDVKWGAQLFEKIGCIKCHTVAKDQPLKGPFLGDITKRYSTPEIIESILKPSAKIAQGFTTVTVTMKDDTEYDGFIVRESGDTLELRNLSGPITIAKKDIAHRGTRKISIMPEGLLDHSTPDDLASLLAYLRSLAPN